MMDAGNLVIGFAGLMLVVGVVTAIRKRWKDKRETEKLETELARMPAVNANATTSDHGANSVVPLPSRTLTAREQLEQTISEKLQTNLCLTCNDRAILAAPAYEQVQPWFERVLRYFNAPLQTRYRVVTDRGVDAPYAFCGRCHERAVGLMMAETADKAMKQARFIDEQRLGLTEFERYGLYEQMFADAQAIKRGGNRKKRGATTATTNVRELRPANGSTGNG